MNRFLKIALIVVGALVVVVAAAAVILPMVVDPNDYKEQITATVKEQTGRDMTIPGDIELSVFPWLGIELGAVRLSNAEGFGDQPFAEIGGAGVRVKILPLLSKRIEIGTVTLRDMRLRLARKENGVSNWDDLVAAFSAEEQAAAVEPPPEPKKTENGFTMPQLEVEAVAVSDAAVIFDDRAAGERYELTELNLSTGRLRSGASFPLELSFRLALVEQGLSTRNTLVAQIEPDLETQFVRLPEFRIEVLAKGEALPKGEQQVGLTGGGEFDAQAGRLKLRDLQLQAAGVTVAAEVDGNKLLDTPEFNGRVTVKTFSPRAVMQRLGMEAPETRDSDVLTSAGLDAQFDAGMERASLKQILVELDDSSFRGEATVRNFQKPRIAFRLDLDQLNADRYMPPKSAGGASKDSPDEDGGEAAPAGAAEIDLEPLKGLNLDGRLSAGKLKVANLDVEDAELAVTASDGVLRIEPLGANLYGGNLRLQSTVSAAGKRPTYAIKGDLNGLHFGPLLKDLVGTEKLEALANMTLDLTTTGTTTREMLRALDGSVSFEFRDGVFNGFNLPKLLSAARAHFQESGAAEPKAAGKTEFSRFAGSFSIQDGLMAARQFALRTAGIEAGGTGSYDLADDRLDYTVNAKVLEEAGGDLAKLAGVTVPIKLSGNLLSPGFSVDMAGALKGAARQKLREEKTELKRKVDEKVQEEKDEVNRKIQKEMQEGLKKLFGGDKDDAAAESESGGGQ